MPGGVIVLKFGGSVLASDDDVITATHEIYRWVRAGKRVVAIVSAFAGETDALCARCERLGATGHDEARAALIGVGETISASLLTLALDRAGLPAVLLDSTSLGLRVVGDPLDASPVSIEGGALDRALDSGAVVVAPGFVGRDDADRACVLGRGGSDLTALVVARHVGAERCRLVKDVDALYEFDPKASSGGRGPRRFATVSWDGALALDESIVQHKAVRFAKAFDIAFEVGCVNAHRTTRVGASGPTWAEPECAGIDGARRVVLLGLGTVGLGVHERLVALPAQFDVVGVGVRDVGKAIARGVDPEIVTIDAVAAASRDCDVVIEAMGGIEPALSACRAALGRGVSVVTANKALIAAHGEELFQLARSTGARLLFGASVGGSAPIVEAVARCAKGGIACIEGVLNGTTNFVLDRLAAGAVFDDALCEAQRLGFAEADPSRDLDGRDAADKLSVLARVGGHALRPEEVVCEPLDETVLGLVADARRRGSVVRHVATFEPDGRAEVRLRVLDGGGPLADVAGEWNKVVISCCDGPTVRIAGKGAGRWPTAEAVVADLLELARSGLGVGVPV